MFSVFLVFSSLLVTSCTGALPKLKVHVCKSKPTQERSINLVHYASESQHSGACSCIINTDSDVTMETEPGNTCSMCASNTNKQRTCAFYCERSSNQKPKKNPLRLLHNGTKISINVTNINGTIMNLQATTGNLRVQCGQTDPVTCPTYKNDVNKGRRSECSSDEAGSISLSKPPFVKNTEQLQKDSPIDIDVCSSNTTRGRRVKLVHGRSEPQTVACTCSIRSNACLTMKHPKDSAQCGICTTGNRDDRKNCTTRCENTPRGCTQNVTITVHAELEPGEMLGINGHKGDNSPEGSAELEVSCNPRSPAKSDDREPSDFFTTTVATAVTVTTILIMLVATLVVVISCRRRKRMKRNPVYMTVEAGSGQATVQAGSPPRPEDAPEQRLNGQTASGSNPSRGHSSHDSASASVHHPTEGGVKGPSHQGEDIRSGPTCVIPKQSTVDEGIYDSADTPNPDLGVGGGGVYGKLSQDPRDEGVYDHALGGTTGNVQQVTGIYRRLGQQVDDDVYDHARRPVVTASVTDGSTYGRLKDVSEDDVYNHTKTSTFKVEAYDNEDFSRLKQDEEVLGKC